MSPTTTAPRSATAWPGPAGRTSALSGDAESQARLQAALTASGIAAWLTNLRTRERWWSAEMFAVHGFSNTDEVPGDYLALVHPDDCALVEAGFQQGAASGAHKLQYRVVWPDGSVHWLEGVGRTESGADGVPVVMTGTCVLIDDRKREEADLRFLAQASQEFARSTDFEETLRRVALLAVPHFADWCAVDMLEGEDKLKRVAVAHVDAAKMRLAEEVHRRYPPDRDAPLGTWSIVRKGVSEILPDIAQELLEAAARDAQHLAMLRSLGLRSYMGIPIRGGDRVLGVITFVTSESGRTYGPRDLELATDLVARASVAVQNAILFRALAQADARQKFLLALTDVLRGTGSTQEVLTRVSEMAGRHFGVDRVGYGHVDESLDRIAYDVCWTDGSVPPLLGEFPASAFGQPVIDRLRAGRTVAIGNVRTHPLTSDETTVRTSHEVETRAILVVPLFKAGALRTIVYLNQKPEREWTREEISLVEEVAERTRELIERGRTERALRQSEGRWRGLFESMAEGFFVGEAIRDAEGRMHDFRFLEVNPAFEKLTGVTASAATGAPVSEAVPGVPAELIARYARVVDTGEPDEFEVLVPVLDDRWFEARARRIAADQFSVLFLEITERKRAQAEVALSAERYRTLFESIDEGFCILEVLFDGAERPVDYRFLEVNPAFERQAGVVNAVGKTIRELVPDIESTYIETYGQVAKTGVPLRFESHAQALQRWFDAFAFRIGEPEQRRVALLFTDITERKLARDALVERELQLREAQRLAVIGSWYWDMGEDRTDASEELLRILGREGQELPPFPAQRDAIYPAADWERLNAAVQAAVSRGEAYSVDLRALRHGRTIWVIARGTAVRDDEGRVVGLRGTLQDITERKLIEEALREADARKDEFLATLAHELRNPLAPIRNGLAILRVTDPGSGAGVRARELMERQLSYLVRLVDDLLDVSRVSQGKVVMKKEVTSLQAVVDLALETSRPLIDAGGHQLTVHLPAEPILLQVDPTRVAQVVSNLLNNAAKYTPHGGHVTLRASRLAADRVQLAVQDDGLGIPAHMLDQVFELFTQVGTALDRSQGGLGVGLSLAKRLVELHGGRIRAESGGAGQGSTFFVELPVLQQPAPVLQQRETGGDLPAATGKRILVVDDNRDAAETLSMLLGFDGHEVQVAHTGADAVEIATRERPDVVFLDIGLPDINGYQVARRLRSARELDGVLLVALTGWGAEADQQRARAAGIDLHLTKPVRPEDLSAALAGRSA